MGLPRCVAEPQGDRVDYPQRTGHAALQFRVDDPISLTGAFSGELPFNRLDEPLYEYACHEGNHAMTNILTGARLAEKDGASQPR